MKLPPWAKSLWWCGVTLILTLVLWGRKSDLAAGQATPADLAVLGAWLVLLISPLFSEVGILGMTVKHELQELKHTVETRLAEVRNEVRASISTQTTFTQNIGIPAPATDAEIPVIEARVKNAVADALKSHGHSPKPVNSTVPPIDDTVAFLFQIRYNLEKELRRIARMRDGDQQERRHMPLGHLINRMSSEGLLDANLASALREVYSVCSPAIHGQPVTATQETFVRDVGPSLVSALQAID